MIFENNCLFLFKKDVIPELRDSVHSNNVDIRMFLTPKLDAKEFAIMVKNSIVYIDPFLRIISYLGGPLKGKSEGY